MRYTQTCTKILTACFCTQSYIRISHSLHTPVRSALTSQLDALEKRLDAKEKECLDTRDERDRVTLDLQRLRDKMTDVERSMQTLIDNKLEQLSKLQADLEVVQKEETLLQAALAEEKNTLRTVEFENHRLMGQKCALETEVEGSVVRIRTLEDELKIAVTGHVHYQSEAAVLTPAKEDLQRKLMAADMDLKARLDEVEKVTKDNVSLRILLESETTSCQEALKRLDQSEEECRTVQQDVRVVKSDVAQMSVELRTSRALATSYENKLAAANVAVDATSAQLGQSVLKCDALGVSIRDFEQQLASTVTTVNRQKDELSNHVDKIEHDEKAFRTFRAKIEVLELRAHESSEREKRLLHDIDELKRSLNAEITQTAQTHSNLVQQQAAVRSLEKELGETRTEGHKVVRNLRNSEASDKVHVIEISDMHLKLSSTRATMQQEATELMQIATVARMAVAQMHAAVLPDTAASDPNVQTVDLISKLQGEACAEARDLHSKIFRLQQQTETIEAKLAEGEELRVQIQNVTHAKTSVEMQLSDANETIEKLKEDVGKGKHLIEAAEENLKLARALNGASEKKARGLQADLDLTIEKNRHEVAKLGKEIADQKEMLGDNRQLAEEMRRLGEANDYFKKLLKASLEAQELTYEALCGAGDGNGGLGMVVSVVNELPRVKSILPGGAASKGDALLRSHDIIEKIDDKSLVGVTFAAVTDLFTGPIGRGSMAAVNLTFLRPATAPEPSRSIISPNATPRLSSRLERNTAANIPGIAQRARDMVSVAEALRSNVNGLECKVETFDIALDRKDVDLVSLRAAREEAVKLINALEQRVRSRDSEIESLRSEALQTKNKLHAANLEIDALRLQKIRADEVITFSQHRIRDLEESSALLAKREKDLAVRVPQNQAEIERLKKALLEAEEVARNALERKRQLDVAQRRAAALTDEAGMLQEKSNRLQLQLTDEQVRRAKAETDLLEMQTLNRQLLDSVKGHLDQWQGVGMTVQVAKAVTIKHLEALGSAGRCGLLQEGDTLLECDGRALLGLTSAQVQNLILGRSGTQVRFLVRPRTGKAFSVVVVRGVGGAKTFPAEMQEAVECAEAMNLETAQLRVVLQILLAQVSEREGDVDRTLAMVERGMKEARLSWLDVSSSASIHAFSVAPISAPKSDAGDTLFLMGTVGLYRVCSTGLR